MKRWWYRLSSCIDIFRPPSDSLGRETYIPRPFFLYFRVLLMVLFFLYHYVVTNLLDSDFFPVASVHIRSSANNLRCLALCCVRYLCRDGNDSCGRCPTTTDVSWPGQHAAISDTASPRSRRLAAKKPRTRPAAY